MSESTTTSEPLFDLSTLNLQELADPFFPSDNLPKKTGEKFVAFHLSGDLFAVHASQIAEVARPLGVTPLPDSPPWLTGVANLRGQIITVINLARLFRKKTQSSSPRSKFIVLKPRNGLSAVAFVADRLAEVVTLAPREIGPADDHRLLGRAVYDDSTIGILDTDQIFSTLL